jgi:probable F420-dependent oxidoreductase
VHPFRFGIQLSGAPTGAAWRDLARKVESLGYSTLYVPDHFDDQWSPTVAITVAAEATTTLNVGALVYDNDYRHPQLLAKEMATLDLATEGRVEVGIGAGWLKTDYEASGIAYDDPAVRVRRMEEAIVVMKALWRDGTCTFKGEFYDLESAAGLPRPHTRPHPPLVIGGGSRKVLGIAGREAQIVGVNPRLRSGAIDADTIATTGPEFWDRRVEWVRNGAGDRFDEIELQNLCFVCAVTDDREAMAAQMAPLMGVDPDVALDIPVVVLGTVAQICDTLRRRRERWGFSYFVFHDAEIDSFAPVVAELAGT